MLQVIETGRALNVGQRFAGGDLRPLEYLTAAERPFELAYKLFEVVLHDTVQIDHVAIDVVDDLHLRRIA